MMKINPTAIKQAAKHLLGISNEKLLFLIEKAAEAQPSDFVVTETSPDIVRGSFRLNGQVIEFDLLGRNIKNFFS